MERGDGDALGVDLEVPAERLAGVAAAEPVRPERDERLRAPARHLVRDRLERVGRRDDRAAAAKDAREVRLARLGLGVQAVPALDLERIVPQELVRGHAPDVGAHVVGVGEKLLRAQGLLEDRTRAKERHLAPAAGVPRPESIKAAEDPLPDAIRHWRHRIVLVVQGDVVKDVLVVDEHPAQTVLHDHRGLVGERRVVDPDVRDRRREEQAVPILVLEALAVERGATVRRAEEEAAAARITKGPHLIAGPLEAEHRIEDVERHHRLGVRRVRGPRRGE